MVFTIATKYIKYLGYFCKKNIGKNFQKYRPIWSHWWPIWARLNIKCTSFRRTPGACSMKLYGSVNYRFVCYGQILTVILLVNCKNSKIYGHKFRTKKIYGTGPRGSNLSLFHLLKKESERERERKKKKWPCQVEKIETGSSYLPTYLSLPRARWPVGVGKKLPKSCQGSYHYKNEIFSKLGAKYSAC